MSLLLDIVDSCLNHANTVDSSKAQTKTMPSLLGTAVAPLDLPASPYQIGHTSPPATRLALSSPSRWLPPAARMQPLAPFTVATSAWLFDKKPAGPPVSYI